MLSQAATVLISLSTLCAPQVVLGLLSNAFGRLALTGPSLSGLVERTHNLIFLVVLDLIVLYGIIMLA